MPHKQELRSHKLSWNAICNPASEYHGKWVALDECEHDDKGRPISCVVVDMDDNVALLCSRLKQSEFKHCEVLRAEIERNSQFPPTTL